MAIDIKQLFDDKLPAAIGKNPDAAKAIGAKFQINIAGADGGQWFLDCSDSGPKAEAGNPGTADCTIDISSEDFQQLVANPQENGMKLFFSGKLKVQGNQMLAMKLQKLFSLAG